MSDVRSERSGRYASFSEFDTETLYQLLDAISLEDDSDSEYLDALLTEIKSRMEPGYVDVNAGWQEFKQFAADIEQDDAEKIASEIQTQTKRAYQNTMRRRRRIRLRYVLAAILVIVVMFSIAVVAGAFPSIREAFVIWTEETFSFSTKPELIAGIDIAYISLKDALIAHGLIEPLAPTWFPDGYVMTDLDVEGEGYSARFSARYEDTVEGEILISIFYNHGQHEVVYEKDSTDIVEYSAYDIMHYIMYNNNLKKVVWYNNHYECQISVQSDMSDENITKIINSIYEG